MHPSGGLAERRDTTRRHPPRAARARGTGARRSGPRSDAQLADMMHHSAPEARSDPGPRCAAAGVALPCYFRALQNRLPSPPTRLDGAATEPGRCSTMSWSHVPGDAPRVALCEASARLARWCSAVAVPLAGRGAMGGLRARLWVSFIADGRPVLAAAVQMAVCRANTATL